MKKIIRFFMLSLFLIAGFLMYGNVNSKIEEGVTEHTPFDVFENDVAPRLEAVRGDFVLREKGFSIAPQANASGIYSDARAYIAVDLDTGEVLVEKNKDESVPVASLTKIMTAVVALDLASPQEDFLISEKAASVIPTKIGVVAGERMSLVELLNAVLLTSANDAAEVIREGIDEKYGEKVFIRAMNRKAEYLGLEGTSFDNPQGFDGRQNYSTAADLAILSEYAISHYPIIAEIVAKDYELLPEDMRHKQFDLYNWNGLVGVYPNTIGLKIGQTRRAGRTTIVASEREGRRIVAVVLGAGDITSRDMYASSLLDDAFASYGIEPVRLTESDFAQKYSTWNYF